MGYESAPKALSHFLFFDQLKINGIHIIVNK